MAKSTLLDRLDRLRCGISLLVAAAMMAAANASAPDPTLTSYTADQCRGSAMPYVVPQHHPVCPDTLKPVFINHVGRHGARFPANSRDIKRIADALTKAASAGTITSSGQELLSIVTTLAVASDGRWGALDSLGMAEQRGIAARMYAAYPELFNSTRINAISSYSPRCVMSMYTFLHQITRLNNHVEISALSGRDYSSLLRFFDSDRDYREYAAGDSWRQVWNDYIDTTLPIVPLVRVMGDISALSAAEARETALAMYSALASTAAAGMNCDLLRFYSQSELNDTWSCANLRQYLLHSASVMSTEPALIAAPLLRELINTTDSAISDRAAGRTYSSVCLRFGHAETLMPLLALMKAGGCYYLTNYFDTVGLHWRNFDIVPMAANLQMVLFEDENRHYYVRFDLNEQPIRVVPEVQSNYVPWDAARAWLVRCLPLFYQD